MNRMSFYVDTYDNVVKCEYYEKTDKTIRKVIKLPSKELHDIFFSYIMENPNTLPTINENINVFKFYDVDIEKADRIIARSEEYQEGFNKKENESTDKQKVKRTNNFKKTVIITSVGVLSALTIFALSKETVMDIDYVDDISTLKITEPISFDFKPHTETIKIGETNDEIDEQEINIDYVDDVDTNIENNIIEEPIIDKEETESENQIELDGYLNISTKNLVDGEKYFIAKAYYYETLKEIADRYGVDPELALAIGIHERGIHSDEVDRGGAVGLFQIQVEGGWNWDNRSITAFNFETNEYEKVLITKDSVSDVFKNIQVGCMMIQNLLVTYDYNVAKAVTAYNYGTENVKHVFEYCSRATGCRISELNNNNNLEWLKYRNIISGGDPEYLENVFKYISSGTILTFEKPNHEIINIEYNNLNYLNDKHI